MYSGKVFGVGRNKTGTASIELILTLHTWPRERYESLVRLHSGIVGKCVPPPPPPTS